MYNNYKHLDELKLAAECICYDLGITKQPRILLTNKLCPCAEDDYYEIGNLNVTTRVIRVRYHDMLLEHHKDHILNTLAHELVHYKQLEDLNYDAAVYMDKYNKYDYKYGYKFNPMEVEAVEYAGKLFHTYTDLNQFAYIASQVQQQIINLIY